MEFGDFETSAEAALPRWLTRLPCWSPLSFAQIRPIRGDSRTEADSTQIRANPCNPWTSRRDLEKISMSPLCRLHVSFAGI